MTVSSAARALTAGALLASMLAGALPAPGQTRTPGDPRYADPGETSAAGQETDWPAIKCARYKKAYADATARLGKRGLGPAFLDGHDAFLASDCTVRGEICPRSPEELALANVLVIMAMNQGMASTFLPFLCRR